MTALLLTLLLGLTPQSQQATLERARGYKIAPVSAAGLHAVVPSYSATATTIRVRLQRGDLSAAQIAAYDCYGSSPLGTLGDVWQVVGPSGTPLRCLQIDEAQPSDLAWQRATGRWWEMSAKDYARLGCVLGERPDACPATITKVQP